MAGKGPDSGPDFVTIDLVRKLINQSIAQHKAEQSKHFDKELAQQKACYEDLMHKQADVFSKLVRVLMESSNKCFDIANNNWHELKKQPANHPA